MTYVQTEINSAIGGIILFRIPTDCELPIDILTSRLTEHGYAKYSPGARSKQDAMRLALTQISNESIKSTKQTDENSVEMRTKLEIDEIPRTAGEPQKWVVHRREITKADGNKVKLGFIEMHDNGTVTLPDGIPELAGGSERVLGLQEHFITTANHTKLRDTLELIMKTMAQIPTPFPGITFVTAENVAHFNAHVKPIFANLTKGESNLSAYTIHSTPENVQTYQQDIKQSVNSIMDKMVMSVIAARENCSDVTKGMVSDWVKQIENLRANMKLFNALEVELPYDLSDIVEQLEIINAEVAAKPRKARVITKQVAEAEPNKLKLA